MGIYLTAAQKQVLLGNHEMTTTATALRGDINLGEIEVSSGTVTGNFGTRGGRDAAFASTTRFADRLDPMTDRVILKTGVRDYFDITLFTGRVDAVAGDERGGLTAQLLSAGAEALRDDFPVPWAAFPPVTAATEITKILTDVNPSWGVDISRATPRPLEGQQIWESDRGQALDQIASGANLVWMPDRYGSFVVFDNPYSIGSILADTSVVTLTDGQEGCLVTVRDTKTRVGVYNSITVVLERTDNSEPLRFTARDENPLSVTRWGGPFGRQAKTIKNPATFEPAALAQRLLRQSLSLRRSWTIRAPHIPILDPGDIFVLWYHNEVTAQVVETTQYDLAATGESTITSRELIGMDLELL